MNITDQKEPSEKAKIMLASLQTAVTEALEIKRKLGQYWVVSDGNKPVFKGPAAPEAYKKYLAEQAAQAEKAEDP